MPVYEYKCKACEREFEYQQRMADPDKTLCEACGAEALVRQISRTAFQLKGGGWYKDLYASTKPEAKGSDAAASTPAAPAAPAAGASSTPAAPAASTPAAPASSTPAASTSGGGSGSSSGGGGSGGTGGGGKAP